MNDVEFMDVFDATNDLLENSAGLILWNSNLKEVYFLHLTM